MIPCGFVNSNMFSSKLKTHILHFLKHPAQQVCGDIFFFGSFLFIFGILDPFTETPQDGFPFGVVHGDDLCCSDRDTSLDYVRITIYLLVTCHIQAPRIAKR